MSVLGLGQRDTNELAIALIALFLGSTILVVPRTAPLGDSLVYGLALCSPAAMLAIERANVDIVLFPLLVAAALALRRRWHGSVGAHAAMLLAAVLKLFPIFAVGMLVRRPRREAIAGSAVVVLAFGIYALATLSDIREIGRVVPQTDVYSYGMRTFGVWWSNAVPPFSARIWDTALFIVALGVSLGVLLGARERLASWLPAPEKTREETRDLDLFWAGASIYVLTFVLFQSFDYRLIFLVLALPQLLRWARDRRPLALASICLLILTQWLVTGWSGVPVIGSAVKGWEYVTAFRPLAHYNSLSLAATSQLMLALALLAGLVATSPLTGSARARARAAPRTARRRWR